MNCDDISGCAASLEEKQHIAMENAMDNDKSDIGNKSSAGDQRDPPSCYNCLLSMCIVQRPPLMTHPRLQWFHSKVVKIQVAFLAGTKVQGILKRPTQEPNPCWWRGKKKQFLQLHRTLQE